MSWQKVCAPKVLVGLGIKYLDLVNLSLLGKWRWRLLVGDGECWRSTLQYRYGDLGRVEHKGNWSSRNSSQWWRDLMSIDQDSSFSHQWFAMEVRRKVGNGVGTSFWHEQWFRNSKLRGSS